MTVAPSRGCGSNPPHGITFLPLNTFTLEPWNPSPVRTLDGCTFQPGKAWVSFGVLSRDSIALMRRARGRKALRSPGRCNLHREVRQMHRRSKSGTVHSCPLQPGHRLEPQCWENPACSLYPPECNNTQMLRWGNKILEVGKTAS